MQLESQGLLSAHMNQHILIYACDECDFEIMTPAELNVHKKSQHGSMEWNCNNCSFQASGSSELRNHLKLTGHQPTPDIQDSKSKIYQYDLKKWLHVHEIFQTLNMVLSIDIFLEYY